MKYILLILLVAFTHNSYSQKTISFDEADSLSKHSDIRVKVKWDTANHSFMYQIDEPPQPMDTVFVVMLLSDTSEQNVDDLGKVYLDFGYEIRKISYTLIFNTNRYVAKYDHVEYLNFDKQKISKNIIIWQSKQF